MKIKTRDVATLLTGVIACAIICCASAHVGRIAKRRPPPYKSILWSEVAEWNGKTAKKDVVIPADTTVVLDVDPPALGSLKIDGALVFADKNLRLAADDIQVTGALRVGTEKRPFRHHAEIVLGDEHGPVDTKSSRAIDVIGGVLDLHGEPRRVTWTHLGATALAGSSTLQLDGAVDWRAGDQVVVASTDFDAAQCEMRTIQAVSATGVILDSALAFDHNGTIEDGVDERAEVGLLSHNIVVHGANTGVASRYGGQIMMMNGAIARISEVECYHMGQDGRLGCYPIHFHRLGDSPASYVCKCSIHHCYNRCITIHGTNHVHLTSNVCFDTIGHCYFMEDGIETGNVIQGNLGMMTRRAQKGKEVLPSDLRPATFWITNPRNIVEGNAAAGSEEFGFWYALPEHPTGASRTATTDRLVWPRRVALGSFAGNTAHSNGGDGLAVDDAPNPPGVSEAPTYMPPVTARFIGLTAYKNRKHGAWIRGVHVELAGCRIADNPIGVTLAASESEVTGALFVGETANHPESVGKLDQPDFPIRGFEFYDGLVGVRDSVFKNFEPNNRRAAGALSYLRFSPFFVDPRNWASGCRFEQCNRVYLDDMHTSCRQIAGDGYRSAVFVDRDGSVTGQAGASVTVRNPLLVNTGAHYRPEWNASVQTACYGRLFIDDRDPTGAYLGPVRLSVNGTRGVHKLWGVPDVVPRSFQSVVVTNRRYAIAMGSSPEDLRLTLRSYKPGDWVVLSLPLDSAAFDVFDGDGTKRILRKVSTVRALDAESTSACCVARGRLRVKLCIGSGSSAAAVRLVRRHDAAGSRMIPVKRTALVCRS